MRRQGCSLEFMEEFTIALKKSRANQMFEESTGESQGDNLTAWVKQHGHPHSDFDSDREGDPWDEYNKIDTFTSLETKIKKKLNQYPHIDLQSYIPYLNDNHHEKKSKKEDPQ